MCGQLILSDTSIESVVTEGESKCGNIRCIRKNEMIRIAKPCF